MRIIVRASSLLIIIVAVTTANANHQSIGRIEFFDMVRPKIGQFECRDSLIALYGGTLDTCRNQVPAFVKPCERNLSSQIPDSFRADSANIDRYTRAYFNCVAAAYEKAQRDSPEAEGTRSHSQPIEPPAGLCKSRPSLAICQKKEANKL